jgi:hypothetical protein
MFVDMIDDPAPTLITVITVILAVLAVRVAMNLIGPATGSRRDKLEKHLLAGPSDPGSAASAIDRPQ